MKIAAKWLKTEIERRKYEKFDNYNIGSTYIRESIGSLLNGF